MPLTLKQLAKFIANTLLLSFIALLVLFAITAGLVRIFTPVLAQQKALIERVASFALAQPVQIGGIRTSWDSFTPALILQQDTIGTDSATQQALKFSECEFDLNVFDALLTGHVQLERVKIVGTQLIVHELPDNSFSINGLW